MEAREKKKKEHKLTSEQTYVEMLGKLKLLCGFLDFYDYSIAEKCSVSMSACNIDSTSL